MIDLLASTSIAAEFFDRTASTPKVQQIVALSLAPAFLLSGIGAIMNVMMARMIWIAGRIDKIDDRIADGRHDPADPERPWLLARRKAMQHAVMVSTGSAASISVVITLLFLSAYVETRLGTLIVVAWVLTMLLLIVGLGFFFRETRLAARGPR
ncbi:DUF2721 domain-containing protein [Qipengyuania sediminis]|uniref:DUF2721 domain-containing protein n=1 Tax=Qipengyuania sediminis TaxID=1532023 RepID=UPI0010593CE3|nr:DUF2721 domain-containing protein [Qipengyuania sediminis]